MKSRLPSLLWLTLPLSLAAACSSDDPVSSAPGSAGMSGAAGASAGAPSAGATSAGATSAGGVSSVAGAPSAGSSGLDAGAAGTENAGAGGEPEADVPSTHPLTITASKALHSHSFLPKDADPTVSADTFSGTNKQVAQVDPRAAKMMGKLVVNLGGAGSTGAFTGGAGAFAVKRGFHVFSVAYYADFDILIGDADYYGDARLEEFDGQDHTSRYALRDNEPSEKLGLKPADGVEQRVRLGLTYLDKTYKDEDWGYYLTADGKVRWSDVIFTGVSHGASSAVRFAMLVRASRAIAFSGPRDNTCASLACTEKDAIVATWFGESSKTPRDRFFAITGVVDSQHTQHLVAFEKLGIPGTVVDVDSQSMPYAGTHRLKSTSADHGAFCDNAKYRDACNYLLDVPPENRAGVP